MRSRPDPNVVQFTAKPPQARVKTSNAYAELMVTSNFSFLRGGSQPQELVNRAAELGLKAIGLCDRNSFAGVVRGFTALRDLKSDYPDFRYVVGVRLCFADGTPDIIAYPRNLTAYSRLCALLTLGNSRAEKGDCILRFEDLWQTKSVPAFRARNYPLGEIPVPPEADFTIGQLFIVQVDETQWEKGETTLEALAAHAPGQVWLAANCRQQGEDRARLSRLADLARRTNTKLLAVNDVLYHAPERRMLQDTLTCIREHLTIFEAGRRLEQNAERHLKPADEMVRLFAEYPQAIAQTQALLAQIDFSLDELRYNYPEETIGNGETAQETLERLTWTGATKRYPNGVPDMVIEGVKRELTLIAELKYAAYFLTVHDIVRYARYERDILCQGRGSAANSMVCFCLEVTEVEPVTGNLVFGRFLSTERNEPPDIDIDFEHERREEVMQYIYQKYGRLRAGLTATVVTYRSKGAMRDVAKVFGLSSDAIDALNGMGWGWYARQITPEQIKGLGFDPADPILDHVLTLSAELMGFPRHLSQHVGGFILTRDRLDHLVPISNAKMDDRTVVEWDKGDIEALGLLKVDVLALGMLTCLRRAFDMMETHYGQTLTLAGLLAEEGEDKKRRARGEPALSDRVYAMVQRADTIGVFQIESRAQMSMLPRLKPKEFYDLVIEVAIVRPGPIQGGMVHPYLKRRMGLEKVVYPSEELKGVLERTCGVPLFQEQAMQIAVVGAGFSPGEADQLRRSMATFKRTGRVGVFREKFLNGMKARNYPEEFAQACFRQIEGFGSYGFPESHAASFALLVYVSCWLKCHYPDVFAAALLNSQPMGFYAPAQIVRDAIEHGVEVHPVDINHSDYLHSLEAGTPARERVWARHKEMIDDIRAQYGVRLGFKQITGFSEIHAEIIVGARGDGYKSVREFWLRTKLPISAIEKLAEADAFTSLGLKRREALWAVKGLMGGNGAEILPLFAAAPVPAQSAPEPDADLPHMQPGEEVVTDYQSLTLSLKAHPLSFLRPKLMNRGTLKCEALVEACDGSLAEAAGLVLVRQRPGTASGIVFITLEDETGIANIVVWAKVFEANRKTILGSRLLAIKGQIQREGIVTHLIAREFTDMTPHLMEMAQGQDFSMPSPEIRRIGNIDGQDELRAQYEAARAARIALPGGRNFH